MRSPFRALLLASLALLFLSACEDPSNVGISLVDEQAGEPEIVSVSPTPFENEPLRDVTGNSPGTHRTLAGEVIDPVLGTLTAIGYLDFQAPTSPSDAFTTGPVTSVRLLMTRDYTYGDTTATVSLILSGMEENWESLGARADTVLTAGALVHTFSVSAQDTLITVPLPASWVSEKEGLLRSTTFTDDFHGFQLAWESGEAVLGFSPGTSSMEVVSGSDTLYFAITKTLSTLTRANAPQLPEGRVLLQDGFGPGINLNFDFKAAAVSDNALNRVIIRLPTDTETLRQQSPEHFYRPPIGLVGLFGITTEENTLAVVEGRLDEDGVLSFEGSALRNVFQQMMLDNNTFERFQIWVPIEDNTINPLLFYGPGTGAPQPEAVLTITPVN